MSLEQALHANTEAVLKNIEVSLRIANLLAGMQLQTSIVTTEILEEVVNTAIAETTTETATEAAPVEETKTSENTTHNYDDVKVALMSVAKVSRAKLQSILDEFGVANISAIDPSDYSRVIELAEKALETADA